MIDDFKMNNQFIIIFQLETNRNKLYLFRDWNKFHAVPADPINPSIKETFSNVMISLADFKIEMI